MAILEKWEYKIMRDTFTPEKGKKSLEHFEIVLNKLGAEGWEWVNDDDPIGFFNNPNNPYTFWRRRVSP